MKSPFVWALILLFTLLFLTSIQQGTARQQAWTYSQFYRAAVDQKLKKVTITGQKVEGETKDGTTFHTIIPADNPKLLEVLQASEDLELDVQEERENIWLSVLIGWFPILLFMGVLIFFMRQMQGGGSKAMSFGKARTRLRSPDQRQVTFSDVAGVDEAVEELQEIVEFLRDPQKFSRLGGRIPKGVLLVGPPGTGKTLLARAVAGEADVPFFSISGSDFVEMFVGVGASRVRDLFEQGKRSAPCLIFVDEIDAVGRHRGAGLGGGHDEREQTLNQLLVEMDGFDSNDGVILIAATNRPDVLDPALLRPGRFDRQVVVDLPDIRGREAILRVHVRKLRLGDDVDLADLARGTPGFTGADLENMANEAALLAARRNKDRIDMEDFEDAKDKVLMGPERRSLILSESERRSTAYHEAGHALVAELLPDADPVHKVTIIPRGRALGLTMQLPLDDRHSYTKEHLLDRIAVLMAGATAERIVFDKVTTGAANDIEHATSLARQMVTRFGMSEELGPLAYGRSDSQVFLGRELGHQIDYSVETAVKIDREMRRIVLDGAERAMALLQENIQTLHQIAALLLENESLDHDELRKVIGFPVAARAAEPLDEAPL